MFDSDNIKRQNEVNGFEEMEDGSIREIAENHQSITSVTVDEIIAEENGDFIKIGLNFNQVIAAMPFLFTPSGKIRKAPGFTGRQGFDDTVAMLSKGVRVQRDCEGNDLVIVKILTPAGMLHLDGEIAEYLASENMYVSIASKGWHIESQIAFRGRFNK